MMLNQRLRTALEQLGMPVLPDVDTGNRERCMVFHYDLRPAQFAGNEPCWYKALVQVHLFLPLGEDGVALQGQVIRALAGAGFTWPEVVDATDEEGQHKVFECELLLGKDEW